MSTRSKNKYKVGEIADLIKYLKDDSLTLQEVAQKMDRSVAGITQKLTEIAVEQIKRGADPEEVMKNTRARQEDIDLLMSIEDPRIARAKELVEELSALLKQLK